MFVLQAPFVIINWLVSSSGKGEKKTGERGERGRKSVKALHVGFNVLKTHKGSFEKWENNIIKADSTIGLILGARGSGKTAFGMKLLENVYSKTGEKCYAMGFPPEEMPSWIEVVSDVKSIKNDSFVLVDEGGILFSARRAMTTANKLLSDLILIARHKNLSIIFITQNSANLEVNVIRQADYLVMKKSSLLQMDFERKKIKEIYEKINSEFNKYGEDKGVSYIYSEKFQGFVENSLPSFWSVGISKSFR